MVACPNCGAQSTGHPFCTTCGTKLPAISQQQVSEAQPMPDVRPAARKAPSPKYGVLRAVAIIYTIIGWVICVGGSVLSIAAAVMTAQGVTFLENLVPEVAGSTWIGVVIIGVGGVVVSVLGGLFLLAFAELCDVTIDIEQRTRSQE